MPRLKQVGRLENLCGSKVANHLFSVFSSWYKHSGNGLNIDIDAGDVDCIEYESLGNATLLKLHGLLNDGSENGDQSMTKDCDAREEKYLQQLTCNETATKGTYRGGSVSPIPLQYKAIDAVTHWLARCVRDYMLCSLAPRFREEVLRLFNKLNCKQGRTAKAKG